MASALNITTREQLIELFKIYIRLVAEQEGVSFLEGIDSPGAKDYYKLTDQQAEALATLDNIAKETDE